MTLLVVEDRENHLADVKEMLATEMPHLPLKLDVIYASTLEEAERFLDQADIVMTDVFFPAKAGGDAEEANGKVVVERCLEANKPVVWVTSTHHHGRKTNAVSEWGRRLGMEMFDCDDVGNGDGEHKPWKAALFGLFYAVVRREFGNPKAMAPQGKEHVPRDEAEFLSYAKSGTWKDMKEMGFRVSW